MRSPDQKFSLGFDLRAEMSVSVGREAKILVPDFVLVSRAWSRSQCRPREFYRLGSDLGLACSEDGVEALGVAHPLDALLDRLGKHRRLAAHVRPHLLVRRDLRRLHTQTTDHNASLAN